MAGRMNGKSAIVTGAASGLGKAIVLGFLREGANVLATDINETRLKDLEGEVEALGAADHFHYTICNVSKTEDCNNAVDACVKAFGTCNVLSNNASTLDDYSLVGDIDDAMWDRIISINLTGAMKICRAALNYFVSNGVKATIVLTTSDAVVQSATGGAAYNASKCGADSLVRSIAFEYGRNGIRINSVGPGSFDSNIMESIENSFNPAGLRLHVSSGYNAHKSEWAYKESATPEDLANIHIFLASDESDYVCGAYIRSNGGISLG